MAIHACHLPMRIIDAYARKCTRLPRNGLLRGTSAPRQKKVTSVVTTHEMSRTQLRRRFQWDESLRRVMNKVVSRARPLSRVPKYAGVQKFFPLQWGRHHSPNAQILDTQKSHPALVPTFWLLALHSHCLPKTTHNQTHIRALYPAAASFLLPCSDSLFTRLLQCSTLCVQIFTTLRLLWPATKDKQSSSSPHLCLGRQLDLLAESPSPSARNTLRFASLCFAFCYPMLQAVC